MGQAQCTCGGRDIMMQSKASKAAASLEPQTEAAGAADQPPQAPVKSNDVVQEEIKETGNQDLSQSTHNEK